MLGLRFTGDTFVPPERFDRLREELGDNFVGVEIDSSEGNPHGNPKRRSLGADRAPRRRARSPDQRRADPGARSLPDAPAQVSLRGERAAEGERCPATSTGRPRPCRRRRAMRLPRSAPAQRPSLALVRLDRSSSAGHRWPATAPPAPRNPVRTRRRRGATPHRPWR